MHTSQTHLATFSRLLTITTAATLISLTGCSIDRLEPGTSSVPQLRGHAHGGQQPVSGALIQLFATGSAGNASAATQLLTQNVVTDANGNFTITGDYTCPSANAQMYITATGGNPGLAPGTNNTALALVAALGSCSSLASTANISISELTTVAAAWALAPFASSVTNVGASSTNTAGLANAMTTALTLVDSTSGQAPSSLLPSNATTETAKLISLANTIASCVNSDGTTPCAQLFSDASPSLSASLSDTFQAALTIVSNPGNNVTPLFNDAPPAAAFGGGLTSAPSDWTMSLAYSGGGLNSPAMIAIDGSGNVLVSSLAGAVSSFSPQGSPLWQNGISGYGLDQSVGIAIDPSANIWVTNMISAGNVTPGSITQIAPSGAVLSGSAGFSGGSINQPVAIAADNSGTMWVANLGQANITVLASDGTSTSGASGYGAAFLTQPSAVAIDASQNAWVADAATGNLVHIDHSGNILSVVSCCQNPDSLAIDSAGTLWAGDNTNSILSQVSSAGAVVNASLSGGGLNGPRAITVDGADHLWITDNNASTFTEFAGTNSPQTAATALSPPTGFGADAQMQNPFGVGVDRSGNVWVSSFGDNRVIAFVGLATPVLTPRIGLPQQP